MVVVCVIEVALFITCLLMLRTCAYIYPCNNQGDQRSPGIIPLAVKDAFSIIQEVLYNEFSLHDSI